MRTWTSRHEADTEEVGATLARELDGDGILLLEGDLGSGKTVLVRGLARSLGVDPREVQSPTYTLIHEYETAAAPLVHVDLYRVEADEIDALGLDELLAGPGIKAVEWAERLAVDFPGAWRVRILARDDGTREIQVDP